MSDFVKQINFSDYEIFFYGSGIKEAPQTIINQGSNKELLGACNSPKTRLDLQQRGIAFNDKQIALLQEWRLIKTNDQIIQTVFPILDNGQTRQLRKFTKSIAPQILQAAKPEIENFLQTVGKEYQASAYILFFSYVIDGLIWDYFTDKGLAPNLSVKNKQDLWVGILWGSFAPRSFFLGTNGYVFDGIYYTIAWNNNLLPKLKPLFLHPNQIPQVVKHLEVPIIHEVSGNHIYDSSLKLSKRIAEEVINLLDLSILTKEYDLADEKQTLVIVYHELMWDILEEVENLGPLSKPPVIANPEKAQDSDIASLIFLVKSNP